MIAITTALAKEPGQVAVEFLEKVREGKVDLQVGGDTALSPHITESKRKLIEETIRNLSTQIGKGELSEGNVRLDGEYAAVMVIQGEGVDQSQLQVYPVALVKGDKGWRATPILASFENTVSAFAGPLKERLSALEVWMMQQRVLEMESLMKRSSERLRDQIKSSIPAGLLTTADPLELLERFQKAYSEDRQTEVLAYLGGYSEKWPSDWDKRLEVMRDACSPKVRGTYPWRLLASPHVVRVVVDQSVDEKEALISLACLDPEWVGESRVMDGIHLLHFSFHKDEAGHWRLNLPDNLQQDKIETFLGSQGLDGDLLEVFPERLRKSFPPKYAESFEAAEQEVIGLLENGKASELLRWVHFEGEAKASRDACVLALKDLWSLQSPRVFRTPVKMGSRVEGEWAVTVYRWFSINQADHMEFRPMLFRRVEKGWVWVPGSIDRMELGVAEIFTGWMKREQMQWRENAKKQLLESVLPLKRLDLEKKVGDGEIEELVKKWNAALKEGRIQEMLRMSARLGEDGDMPQKLFKNLVRELLLVQRAEKQLTGIYRAGKWVAVGFIHREGEAEIFSLMLAASTEQGLKFLPQIDLISDGERTRKFLNMVSLDLLKTYASEAELEEIKRLFEDLETKVR